MTGPIFGNPTLPFDPPVNYDQTTGLYNGQTLLQLLAPKPGSAHRPMSISRCIQSLIRRSAPSTIIFRSR